MFFDAVLSENGAVLFNGTPAEVKEWLQKIETPISTDTWQVGEGATLRYTTVEEYLNR